MTDKFYDPRLTFLLVLKNKKTNSFSQTFQTVKLGPIDVYPKYSWKILPEEKKILSHFIDFANPPTDLYIAIPMNEKGYKDFCKYNPCYHVEFKKDQAYLRLTAKFADSLSFDCSTRQSVNLMLQEFERRKK